MLHKATIAGITMDPSTNTPIIILKTEEGGQAVPIWIGLLEATSIASALQNVKFDRPMTHDLFKNFATLMEVSVSSIEVCDLKDNTFFARVNLMAKDSNFSMDARPSDAIAIALRFAAPIFIDEAVIAKSRPFEAQAEVLDESEEGRKWKEYLENLNPDDFGKYKV